jgi:hypothetical protein
MTMVVVKVRWIEKKSHMTPIVEVMIGVCIFKIKISGSIHHRSHHHPKLKFPHAPEKLSQPLDNSV